MRKPQSIIIGLVGAGVATGALVNSFHRPSTSYRSSASASYGPRAARRVYQMDEFVPGMGYFHAPFRSFYMYRWNYHDPALGYFHGGSWSPQPMQAKVQSGMPNEDLMEQQRRGYTSSGTGYHGWNSYGRSGGTSASTPSSAGSSVHSSGGSASHTSFGGFGSHGSSSS